MNLFNSSEDVVVSRDIFQTCIKDILHNLIDETRKEYPYSLKVEHLSEITGYSDNSIYLMLEAGDIPGAKKIKGWRVPRDTFLLWWNGDWLEENILLIS